MLYREIHLSDFEDISGISDLIANVFNTLKRRKKNSNSTCVCYMLERDF